MLHEAIHAYLITYYSINQPSFIAQYPQLVDAWNTTPGLGLGAIHHTEMVIGGFANGWIGDVAWSLKQYGISKGYNLPDQFYMDMAWGGLEGTAAFNALPAADKARIKDTIQAEALGTNNQGLPASQSGTNAGC